MINKSNTFNSNYAAKIVTVNNLTPHPNAHSLMIFKIDGNEVITSKDTKIDDTVVYFPVLSVINKEYLSQNNAFRDSTLNEDKEAKGFFDSNGVVKPTRLRGIKSNGFIMPIKTLEQFSSDFKMKPDFLNIEFDTIGNTCLVKKYIVPVRSKGVNKGGKPAVKKSKLIENQFRFHTDTSQLGKSLFKFDLDTQITITYKLHGTSAVFSNVLCKKPLSLTERVLKWFGSNIVSTEYSNIYSSRKVIKNENMESKNHFYSEDIWGKANNRIKELLLKGESIYAEIVGYVGDGMIQSNYDYGCKSGEFEIYVYRITHTNADGKVIELAYEAIRDRAEELGVKVVPLLYKGAVRNYLGEFDANTDFQQTFLNKVREEFSSDVDCYMCKNKVPQEGCCVRIEKYVPETFKSKSFKFLEQEFKDITDSKSNIEDAQ